MKRIYLSWARGLVPVVALLLAVPLAHAAPYAYVANSASNTVSVINTATNTVKATINVGYGPFSVVVSPDGRRIYVANGCVNSSRPCNTYGAVSVIDAATDTTVGTPIAVGNGPYGVAVSPDGSRLYVTNNESNTVSVIDTATDAVNATVKVGSWPAGVAVSPDGSRIYVANGGDNNVSVINAATDATVGAPITVGWSPAGVAVSPDGSRVYVTNTFTNNVSVIDAATDTVKATVTLGRYYGPEGVTVSPDGGRVYVVNNGDNTVSVINAATDTTVGSPITVGSIPSFAAVSPDGSRIYVTSCESGHTDPCTTYGTVSAIDTATDATVGAAIAVGENPLGVVVGPGALIATNSSASGGAGAQISGTVPTLTNSTTCTTSDALV